MVFARHRGLRASRGGAAGRVDAFGLDQWRSSPTRPRLDARYYAAMDRLDLAEDERVEAATAMVRERDYSG